MGWGVDETHGEKKNYSSHHPNHEVTHAPPSANGLGRRAALVVGEEEGPEGDCRVKFPLPLPPSLQPATHCTARADTQICRFLPAVCLGLTFLCLRCCPPPRVQRHASHQVCRGGRWVGTSLVCCGCGKGGAVTKGKKEGGYLAKHPQLCFRPPADCVLFLALSSFQRARGPCPVEGTVKGISKRGMESGAGLSHAQEVVLLPDSTRRQELDLKPKRCKHSPACEWLLEGHLLIGAD